MATPAALKHLKRLKTSLSDQVALEREHRDR